MCNWPKETFVLQSNSSGRYPLLGSEFLSLCSLWAWACVAFCEITKKSVFWIVYLFPFVWASGIYSVGCGAVTIVFTLRGLGELSNDPLWQSLALLAVCYTKSSVWRLGLMMMFCQHSLIQLEKEKKNSIKHTNIICFICTWIMTFFKNTLLDTKKVSSCLFERWTWGLLKKYLKWNSRSIGEVKKKPTTYVFGREKRTLFLVSIAVSPCNAVQSFLTYCSRGSNLRKVFG